jgi:hypothetical protein
MTTVELSASLISGVFRGITIEVYKEKPGMTENPCPEKSPADLPVIESLTGEQDRLLIEYMAHFHELQRKEKTDRQEVKAAITRLYQRAKTKTPSLPAMPPLLFCQSPWQMVTTAAMLALLHMDSKKKLRERLSGELQDPLWKRMWSNLGEQLNDISFTQLPGDSGSFDQLLGDGIHPAVVLKSLITTLIAESGQTVDRQLSLRIKLRMREVAREQAAEGNRRRQLPGPNTAPIRAQFGMLQLRGFTGAITARNFFEQIHAKTQEAVSDLCNKRWHGSPGMFGLEAPKLEPADNLFELLDDHLISFTDIKDFRDFAFLIKYLPVQLEQEVRQAVLDWLLLKKNFLHISFREKLILTCQAPATALLNNARQAHCEHGPALEFEDGFKVYAWNGVVVPAHAIMAGGEITLEQIDKETNIEVRRILIQQYGLERYLADSGAIQIAADECGVLYKKMQANDEPIVVVKVTNPTPEPDGSHKHYFLRVPPQMTSARAAVAWTFDIKPEEYEPGSQS